ncbi:hypothetical protein [Runella salmonicolor]|uniref:Uncharacterized protein n=1 Tax=Runella salmonicolor TaxID=2950278 RepID=A0ABT1G0W3_9BACT|nr:hypothetical protein [Runella salmonicolor]MCP1386372.1 hypothetical protein [Runella salmonicolor]
MNYWLIKKSVENAKQHGSNNFYILFKTYLLQIYLIKGKLSTIMQNTTTSDQQMTDVFQAAQQKLSAPTTSLNTKLSNRQKAFISTATVLLGGGAAFTAVRLGVFGETTTNESIPRIQPEPISSNQPVKHHNISPVQNGSIKPGPNIDIAGGINESMTFEQAYAAAREEVGPGGIFSWHGEVYNTYTVEEWQGLSLAQRQDFLSDVDFKPTGMSREKPPVSNQEPLGPEPIYVETIINGRPALGIDDDRDGVADAIVIMDIDTNSIIAVVDNEGDDRLDTVIQIDIATNEIIKQESLDTPALTAMSSLEPSNQQSDSIVTANAYTASTEEETDEISNEDESNDEATDEGYINDAEMPEME